MSDEEKPVENTGTAYITDSVMLWRPTNQLRWTRLPPVDPSDPLALPFFQMSRLQQLWVGESVFKQVTQWRDVPSVIEPTNPDEGGDGP